MGQIGRVRLGNVAVILCSGYDAQKMQQKIENGREYSPFTGLI